MNLVSSVSSFYIRTRFTLKNRVTTVHLLQCKTNFYIHLRFWGRNLRQIKEHPSWFVYTRLHSSTLVYICLDSSSGSSTHMYIRLDSSSDLSAFVYIRLESSNDSLHSSTFAYTRLHSSTLVWWLVCAFIIDQTKVNGCFWKPCLFEFNWTISQIPIWWSP